jgi:hypothetical protein
MTNPVPQFPRAQELGSTSPLDLPEMEKLLTKVEDKGDKALNLSKSLSGALDLEQNGHSLPFKVISERHRDASLSGSPSRASSRRASSIITTSYAQDQEVPNDYLVLAIASCFCPVWPLNLIPLIFSIMVSTSFQGWGLGPDGLEGQFSGRGITYATRAQRKESPGGLVGDTSSSPYFFQRGPGTEDFCFCASFISALGHQSPASSHPCWGRRTQEPPRAKFCRAERQPSLRGLPFWRGCVKEPFLHRALYQQKLHPEGGPRAPYIPRREARSPGPLGILPASASFIFQAMP